MDFHRTTELIEPVIKAGTCFEGANGNRGYPSSKEDLGLREEMIG
jgi:hypothetical protein